MKNILLTAAFLIASFSALAGQTEDREHARDPAIQQSIRERKAYLARERARLTMIPKEKAQKIAKEKSALLAAIMAVETGDEKDPASAVGDSGLAHGWYQIHPDFYADAKTQANFLPNYKFVCKDQELSRLAVVLYWNKYPKAKTDKELALLFHYGNTKWNSDKSADKDCYLAKVQAAMKSAK